MRPYKGYGALRIAENAGRSLYNSLQLSADKRYSNGFKFGMAYTLGKSEDNASDKRNVLWNTYDDSNFWGASSYDRTHVLSVYYIYDLPFWRDQTTLLKNLLGGWQISGSSFFRTSTRVYRTPGGTNRPAFSFAELAAPTWRPSRIFYTARRRMAECCPCCFSRWSSRKRSHPLAVARQRCTSKGRLRSARTT